jgi:hypothetical protein
MTRKSNSIFFLACSIFSHFLVICLVSLLQTQHKPLQQSVASRSLHVWIPSLSASTSNDLDANNSSPTFAHQQKPKSNSHKESPLQTADVFRSPAEDSTASVQMPITNAEQPQPSTKPEALGQLSDPSKFEIDTKALAPNDKMPIGPFGSSSPNTRWGRMSSPIGTNLGGEKIIDLIQTQEMQKRQRKQVFLEAVKLRHQFILSNTENLACLAFINLDGTHGSVTCVPSEAIPQELAMLNGAVLMSTQKPSNALCYPFGHLNVQLVCP